MAELHLSEDEQVEALKRWWKENGTSIIVGALIGIAGIVGVWYWQDYSHGKAERGSLAITEFNEAVQQNKQEVVDSNFTRLKNEFAGTPYPALAALTMAKRSIDARDLVAAETHLRWAMDNAAHESIRHLARIRLARILIQQNKPDDAMLLVADQNDPALLADYAELRGDIYKLQGKAEQARTAYTEALNDTALPGQRRTFIEMKRDDIVAAVTVTEKAQ